MRCPPAAGSNRASSQQPDISLTRCHASQPNAVQDLIMPLGCCRSITYAATPSYSPSSTPTVLRVSRRCQRFARLPRHTARGVNRLTLIRYAPGGLVVRASGRDVIEHEVAELIGAALRGRVAGIVLSSTVRMLDAINPVQRTGGRLSW